MHQLKLHKKIDALINQGVADIDCLGVSALISMNEDAYLYFFSNADERWLDWLWNNGFLDAIKEKAEDSSRCEGMPELYYLMRMAKKVPEKVAGIMLEVSISPNTFNPEVVGRFLEICDVLPPEYLGRLPQKILEEQWIPLMGDFNHYRFEYARMLNALADAHDFNNLLTLAKAILTVRSNDNKDSAINDNFFYFSDLSYTEVFKHLVNVPDEYAEHAFSLVVNVMTEIVRSADKPEQKSVFEFKERFALYDADFFDLELGEKEYSSPRDNNVRELAATLKLLAKRVIGGKCDTTEEARRLYEQYVVPLPNSKDMWRFSLYVISLCPAVFKTELKRAFFWLFEVDRYYEISSGAEYKQALKDGFSALDEKDKREYAIKVIEYFKNQHEDEDDSGYYIRRGSEILSSILVYLDKNPEIKCMAEKVGFQLDPDYKPQSVIGRVEVFSVESRAPMSQEEFGKLAITELVEKLKNEWTPENLRKRNTDADFARPFNADAVGALMKNDMSVRLQEYLNNACLFFDCKTLDAHYTYSFLRGAQETIKNKRDAIMPTIDLDGLIDLCGLIKNCGSGARADRETSERDSFGSWLAGSNALHIAIADLVRELLTEKNGSIVLDFQKYRPRLLEILDYLLADPDPQPKDEKKETAKFQTQASGETEYKIGDPFNMASNSVRGHAFESFLLFVFHDGGKSVNGKGAKISGEVKALYEKMLEKEGTRAIMFLFGRYLPTFYYRDMEWTRSRFPWIFPEQPAKKHLYTAAWEGYLLNNVYTEMFWDEKIQKLYERGLALTPDDYPPGQKHFKDPAESIAEHFMLAYMYYENFGFENKLFKDFWAKENPEPHAKFINSVGRVFISGDKAKTELFFKENPEGVKRLKDFWDWILDKYTIVKQNGEKKKNPFTEFGYWINGERNVFEPVWLAEHVRKTLEKSEGRLRWAYGLTKCIIQLAKEAPEETLKILRLYILDGGVHGANYYNMTPRLEEEWIEAFRILYNNPLTQDQTRTLIDDLIREGKTPFWCLKKIVEP